MFRKLQAVAETIRGKAVSSYSWRRHTISHIPATPNQSCEVASPPEYSP